MRKAYGFGSMVMGMIGFDNQSAVFAFPGATMGAMGAAAMSRSRGSDIDEADLLKKMELEASYRSAMGFGFDELIDPRRSATCCCTRSSVRCTSVRSRPSRSPGPPSLPDDGSLAHARSLSSSSRASLIALS